MKKHYFKIAGLISAIILLSGCVTIVEQNASFSGNGTIATAEESLADAEYQLIIRDIYFANQEEWALITIDEALDQKIVLSTDENILETISITVDDEARTILVKGNPHHKYRYSSYKIEIGVPVNTAKIDGGYYIDFDLPSVTDYEMIINGAVSGILAFGSLSEFSLEIFGASNLTISGACERASAVINGASNIMANDFVTKASTINLRGASKYEVHATESLDARIDGVGSIVYAGNPDSITRHIEGLGSVRSRGE